VTASACPACGRTISGDRGYYSRHGITPGSSDLCVMSGRRNPICGNSDDDYRARAALVCDLAEELQDRDPAALWDYLTVMPAAEIQRLLVIALAAVDIEGRTVDDIFGWVTRLPVAQVAA
jgi:hypothetical protein